MFELLGDISPLLAGVVAIFLFVWAVLMFLLPFFVYYIYQRVGYMRETQRRMGQQAEEAIVFLNQISKNSKATAVFLKAAQEDRK